jgi:uncharacterized membrane protein
MKLWVAFVAAALSAHAQAAVRYTAVELKTPEGLNMQAFGLNNAGEIVGGVQGAEYQAYYRSATGAYQALGGLGGNRSTATAIADNGVLAGMGRTGSTSATSRPFIGSATGINLVPLPDGTSNGGVNGVNGSGTIVGFFREPFTPQRGRDVAFRWTQAGGYEILRSEDGFFMTARAVNASGVAVVETIESALRWDPNGDVTMLEKSSHAVSETFNYSYATDINDLGFMAGSLFYDDATFTTQIELALWNPEGRLVRTATLGNPSSLSPTAMNNANDMVGGVSYFEGFPDGSSKTDEFAVLWEDGDDIVDLNSLVDLPGLKLVNAFGINDRGQIIAWGRRDGVRVDVLLNPMQAAIPEPASWALMIAGFAGVGLMTRRRMRTVAFA